MPISRVAVVVSEDDHEVMNELTDQLTRASRGRRVDVRQLEMRDPTPVFAEWMTEETLEIAAVTLADQTIEVVALHADLQDAPQTVGYLRLDAETREGSTSRQVEQCVSFILQVIDALNCSDQGLPRQSAEALHKALTQLRNTFDVQQMYLDRYRELAIKQQQALSLARQRIEELEQTIRVLEDGIASDVAAHASGEPLLIAQSESWLSRVALLAVGALLGASSTLGINIWFDALDGDDERSAKALERSAEADEALVDLFRDGIRHGGECYRAVHGQLPPELEATRSDGVND